MFTVMADEVTSHHKEQMSFCVRFVDTKGKIRRVF